MKIQDLKALIAKNKLDEVIDILLDNFKEDNNDTSKQIISISNRYSRYKSDSLKGLENNDISKITSDLLDVIGGIEQSKGKKEEKIIQAISNIAKEEINNKTPIIKKMTAGLAIIIFLGVSFGIGLFNGLNSRKLSDDEFYKRYIFSNLNIIKDKETEKYFLAYTCDNNIFYYFNTDNNQILDENFFSGSGVNKTNLNIEINIQDIVGFSAVSSLFLYDNFFNYIKKPFKSGGNIKAKILFTLGLASTYGIGKWIGTRKIPSCNSVEIAKRLEDANFWKKNERYTYNFVNNMMVLGTNNYAINSIANCPLFLMVDSTKIIDKKSLLEITEIEKKYIIDRKIVRTTNHDISSIEYDRFFKRNAYLVNEFNDGKKLTETGAAWKFYNYSIYNYSGFIQDYNFLFEEYIQKIK